MRPRLASHPRWGPSLPGTSVEGDPLRFQLAKVKAGIDKRLDGLDDSLGVFFAMSWVPKRRM